MAPPSRPPVAPSPAAPPVPPPFQPGRPGGGFDPAAASGYQNVPPGNQLVDAGVSDADNDPEKQALAAAGSRQPRPGEETLTPLFINLGGVTTVMTTDEYQNQIRDSLPGARFEREPGKPGLRALLTHSGDDIVVINAHHTHRDLDDVQTRNMYPKGNFIRIDLKNPDNPSPYSILTPDNVNHWRQGAPQWPRVVWISGCNVYPSEMQRDGQPTIPDAFIPNPNQPGFAFIGQNRPVVGPNADGYARDFFGNWRNGIPNSNPNPSLEQVRQFHVDGKYSFQAKHTIIRGDKNMTYQQFLQQRQTRGVPGR
jgi:hypothetical protein